MVYDEARQVIVLFNGVSTATETWLYTFIPVSPGTFMTFGTGCSGSNGTPALKLKDNRLPYIGEEFRLLLSPISNNLSAPAFGVVGASKTTWLSNSLPMSLTPLGFTGCSLYVSMDFFPFHLGNQGGSAAWSMQIPSSVNLVNAKAYLQCWALDFGRNPAHAVVSNAGEVTIGQR